MWRSRPWMLVGKCHVPLRVMNTASRSLGVYATFRRRSSAAAQSGSAMGRIAAWVLP